MNKKKTWEGTRIASKYSSTSPLRHESEISLVSFCVGGTKQDTAGNSHVLFLNMGHIRI
jgi:hypothetical protein